MYNIKCGSCDDTYVGQTARKMGIRLNEHSKSNKESALLEHLQAMGHSISLDDVSILANEQQYTARKVKEALKIYKHQPTLNRDQGWEIQPVLLQLLTPLQDLSATGGPVRVSSRNRANSL